MATNVATRGIVDHHSCPADRPQSYSPPFTPHCEMVSLIANWYILPLHACVKVLFITGYADWNSMVALNFTILYCVIYLCEALQAL